MSKAIDALNIFCKTIQNNEYDAAKIICSNKELYKDNKKKLNFMKKDFFKEKLYKPLAIKMILNRTIRRFLVDITNFNHIVMMHKNNIKSFRCCLEFGIMHNHISNQHNHIFLQQEEINRNKIYLSLTYYHNNLIENQYYIKQIDTLDDIKTPEIMKILYKYIKKNLLNGYYPINFAKAYTTPNNGFDSD